MMKSNAGQRRPLVSIISKRIYGEPKLSKPKDLKNIKQAFSVKLNTKCKCPIFTKGNDVYIKVKDWFSDYIPKELIRHKFIYNDSFGAVVFRNEAWIKIDNLICQVKNVFILDILKNILRDIEALAGFEYLELECSAFSRMIEETLNKIIINTKKGC